MPIGKFFRRGVGELMIARPDEAKGFVVWKHPDPTIPMGSQVTVEKDENALFFRDGELQGKLEAGRHRIDGHAIPFLSDLIDKFTGGRVLIAEVFFVTTREVAGVKFGGQVGYLEDPPSGIPVETMVHGTFSFRVIDPEKLVIGLLGLGIYQPLQLRGWLKEQVLKVIRDRVAEMTAHHRWPLMDVVSGAYTEELEQEVVEAVTAHVRMYGIEIVRLGNFVLVLDEDDEEVLKKYHADRAYLNMTGGSDGFRDFAAGKAMMGAGEGMSGGSGGGGGGGGEGGGSAFMGPAGIGIGLGMAKILADGDSPSGPASAPSAPGVSCPHCRAQVAPGNFCSSCGGSLKPEPAGFCSNCGGELALEDRFCSGCGSSTSSESESRARQARTHAGEAGPKKAAKRKPRKASKKRARRATSPSSDEPAKKRSSRKKAKAKAKKKRASRKRKKS